MRAGDRAVHNGNPERYSLTMEGTEEMDLLIK